MYKQETRLGQSTRRIARWLLASLCALSSAAHADPIIKLLTFQDTPDPVAATQQLTYQLQVSNTSFVSSADGVALTVPIPSGASFVSVSDGACSYSAPNVQCSFGTIPASTNKLVSVVLNVTAAGGATLSSTAVASSTTVGESDSSITQTTSVTAGADLQLQMTGSPDPVTAGGNVTFSLTASNLGPDTASALSIIDTLPPNTSYVSSSGTGWSCSAAGSTVTCSRSGTLANAANTSLSIVAKVNSSINGNITNSATLSATTPDGIASNNTTTASVAVAAGADVQITKSVSPSPVIGNAATTFTLQPRNTGPDAATSVVITDTLPNGFTSINASGTNYTCSVDEPTRTVTCTRATLPVGASDNISVTATAPDDLVVPPGGMASSNTASITSAVADPNSGNNNGTVNFTIQRDGSDLSITKTKSPNPVASGGTLTSVMTVRNNGPRALVGGDTITITDTLPVGEDYAGAASFTNNGWSCTFAAPVFTCTHAGPLALNANSATLTLTTTATDPTSLTNQACASVTGSQIDPNGTNDCTSATSSSTAAHADLQITKSQDLATVTNADNTLTYTLTIKNNGPQDSANVVVTDVIPMRTTLAGGTVISANAGVGDKGSTGSCSVSAATVTCNYASLLYETGAPANTAETAVIAITVTRPMTDGAFTNTATINSTAVGDQDRSNNSSAVNTTVDPVADVQVTSKTVTPTSVRAGVDATYVISIKNNGPSTATGVTLDDEFFPAGGDTGYSIQSVTPSAGSCSPFDALNNLISCSIGSMAANNVQSVTVVARPKWMGSPPSPRTLSNTATIASTTADSNAGNNSKSATLTITPAQVDLIANITDVESFAGVSFDPLGYDGITTSNNVLTYKSTVTNSGPSQATGIVFTNTYTPPAGRQMTFLCDSSSQYSCIGGSVCSVSGASTVTGPTTLVVNCNATDLESGASYSRYLRYSIDTAPAAAGDSYSNALTVTSNESDSNSGNNSASEPTAVRAKADIQVSSKTALIASPPLQYGQTFQWQIKVLNGGPGTAYDTVLTDTLPTNMELVLPFSYSVSPGSGTCTNTGVTQISCSLGDIAAGGADEQTVLVDVFLRKPASAPYPTNYSNTASVTTFSVDPDASNNSNTGSVSLVKSSIAGRVYRDHNNNGAIDAGENGVNGVTLTLTGHDIFNNSVSRSATSDSSGNYLIDSLEQADATGYTLTESQPSGYSDGLETVGTAATGTAPGGTKNDAVGSNAITNIVLDKDQVATGYNFAELKLNTLSGTVFADVNNDGTKQGSEPGIASVTITLTGTDARGTVVNTNTTTNASGAYSFSNVLPGTYQIAETQPTTYVDGTDTLGTLSGTKTNDTFSAITVTDANGTGYNFGERPGTLSGQVWRDANRNATLDGGELGINAVSIALSGTDALGAAVTRNATTNASGAYAFVDLPQGTFSVTETQPTGFGSSTPNTITGISLSAGGTAAGNDFGDSTSRLSGTVFFDRNANGANDGTDSAIAGVAIALTGTNAQSVAVNLSTTTDASGNFAFDDLLTPNGGGYTLTQTQPTAYSNGQITAGTSGGTVTQAANSVSAIALSGGVASGGYLFAELGTVISGTVYRDADRNGTQNGSDVGIANVSVELRDAGNALVATTTTDGSGAYSFPAQPAGSYSVVETQPTAYQSGPENASNTVAVVLVAGTPSTVNFGESAGSFTGIVFLDGNHDGVQDGGEIGLPGVSVALTGTDVDATAVNRTATTNASGVYTFNDVLAGTYTITETQPAVFGDGLDVLGAGNVGGTAGNDVYSAIALTAGTQASGYNFAEEGSAVTGVVFRDANRDGTQQGSDIGLNNVTITLRDNSNVVIGTTTTAADGSYLFGGVPSGNYTVTETQPAGYGSAVTSPDVVNIVVPAGGAATAHFADTVSTLSGSVFIDLDNDGVRDAGEAGVAAINISLTGTDAAGAAVNRTAATDASGNFIFTNVLTPNGGGYTLSEPVQPAAFADGQDAVGTAGGTLANDSISAIALPFNTDATGYTFGELGTTISGVVFKDVNVNGTHEGGDVPLPGITISLHDALNNSVGTTTTAADGTYSFAGLPAGNYVVTESQPAGYGSNSPDSVSVTLAPGGSGTADFAEITSSIAGFVWSDTDNDSTRDAGEPGIANVLITLTGIDAAGQTVNRTAHTDGTGAYLFDDVLGGTYTLSETQPADYADGTDVAGSVGGTVANDSISNIVLPVSTHATGYAFGELGQSITGHVWLDSNRDGQFALSENGIATVTINLRDAANAIVDTKITDAGGVYGFANIPAGHYTIEEVQPLGYGSSTPDSVATDLVPGGTHAPIDFGDTAGSIAGLVYNDTNNNGIRDAGEPAIPAVQIALSGTDARGVAVNVQATSGMDGTYRFSDVVGGTYTLTETQPAAYGDGIDVAGTSGGTVANDVISAIALGAQVDATGYAFAERGLSATISGRVWRDTNHDRRRDADESLLANWSVELYQGTTLLQTVATDANGAYRLQDVAPGSGYEVRFREPVSHSLYGAPVTNESGASIAPGAVGPDNPGGGDPRGGTLTGLLLEPNSSIEQQSLPVDPSGVVYDSVSRKAIAGASVTISGPNGFDPATQLLGGEANATQITNELGLYQFWLLPNAPAGTYTIDVTPPPGRYTPGVSALIPPCSNALNVGAVPAPAVVQNASTPPASSVPNQDASQCPSTSAQLAASAETTQYFYSLALTPGISANVINNNLPVDPILGGALAVTKTTPMVNVSRGDLVPYTITVTNTLNALLTNVDIRDLLPPGFVYRTGTGSVNGQTLEPQRIGRQLTWIDQSFTPHERKTYKLILVVGSGVGEADYVNQAFALNNLIGATISNVATAAVRVVPDPVFDCGDLIGKVFDDRNVNGYQDQDEPGIANVRLVTLNGVLVTTDAEGRYHIACAMIPNEVRGSTFVVKLDERTLPSGFRVTTENPGDVRLTRGKLAKLNFGATVHRVIRIELDDGAFESGKPKLRKEWLDRVVELKGTLAEKPSVVRIAYPTSADARLQKRRKKWVIKQLREQWSTLQRGYPLEIEDEAGARK